MPVRLITTALLLSAGATAALAAPMSADDKAALQAVFDEEDLKDIATTTAER